MSAYGPVVVIKRPELRIVLHFYALHRSEGEKRAFSFRDFVASATRMLEKKKKRKADSLIQSNTENTGPLYKSGLPPQ